MATFIKQLQKCEEIKSAICCKTLKLKRKSRQVLHIKKVFFFKVFIYFFPVHTVWNPFLKTTNEYERFKNLEDHRNRKKQTK